MEVVKKTKTEVIMKKRSGRYGVKTLKGKWINGEEKAKVLLAAGLIKASVAAPKKEEAPAAEEAVAETPAE